MPTPHPKTERADEAATAPADKAEDTAKDKGSCEAVQKAVLGAAAFYKRTTLGSERDGEPTSGAHEE